MSAPASITQTQSPVAARAEPNGERFDPLPAVRVLAKAASPEALALTIHPTAPPPLRPGEALVRVAAAAVNPSDVKAMLGLMPQARWPRTPGRDYAGSVVDGPTAWIGRKVWGSGGDLGITRDGSHAGWLVLPEAALREMPSNLGFDEAGAIGVPFVTACEGFRRSGLPQRGQAVAVFGANGKVGQAAVQLALQAGARVFAVQRPSTSSQIHRHAAVTLVDGTRDDVGAQLRELTAGRGIDIAFNTVGSPYFAAANAAMAKGATQVFIATLERAIPFDIFAFYRGMHTYVGIDSLALDCAAAAERLDAMKAGFESGTLKPFPVAEADAHDLHHALEAYRRVLGGAEGRTVVRP
jgi:NADPH2:quinone reductase